MSLRLMIYDRTCAGSAGLPGLSTSWRVGGALYRAVGALDAFQPVSAWAEGLEWISQVRPTERIAEIQFWGHGHWGCALVDRDPLDVRALAETHPLHARLVAIRNRLVGANALWWFRTCETFGTQVGMDFAKAWSRFFGCRTAGHTYRIGPFQSGLHVLKHDAEPNWSPEEGVHPNGASRWSSPTAPNTITCFHGNVRFE